MPSVLHEALVLLFRNRPRLAPELLRTLVEVPPFAGLRLEPADLGEVVPTEYRADLVLALTDPGGNALLAVVVEVQLRADPRKRLTWPVYESTLRARHGCPALVLVIAATEEVAQWSSTRIDLGPSGSSMTPVVVGPSAVPRITDLVQATEAPELAVLSAVAHGREEPASAVPIAFVAMSAAARLDDERATLYVDLIQSRLGDAARAALEELMQGKYEYQSDFARRYVAEGEARGRAEALLTLLAARKIALTSEVRDRILGCRDLAILDRWIVNAASARTIEDVL